MRQYLAVGYLLSVWQSKGYVCLMLGLGLFSLPSVPGEVGPDTEESSHDGKDGERSGQTEDCVEHTFCASRDKGFCVWFEVID